MSEVYESIMRGLLEIIEDMEKPEEEQILKEDVATIAVDIEQNLNHNLVSAFYLPFCK